MAASKFNLDEIQGNTSPEFNQAMHTALTEAMARDRTSKIWSFGVQIEERTECKEISVFKNPEEPEKTEGRIVMEITVEEDMLNAGGNLHGGCSGFLVDNCSTLAHIVLGQITGDAFKYVGVSLSINLTYHSPALLGDRLRIVSTTISTGARVSSSRCEIWNVTRQRLVASAVHSKMSASVPKDMPAAKL